MQEQLLCNVGKRAFTRIETAARIERFPFNLKTELFIEPVEFGQYFREICGTV